MSQVTQILDSHFDGERNITRGSKTSPTGKSLADLVRDLISQGNQVDAALTRCGIMQSVEYTNPPAADTDFFVKVRASKAVADVIMRGEAEWQTVAELTPPRNATITTSLHADIDAVAVVLTGRVRDSSGNLIAQTDTITLTNGGGTTDSGTNAFSYVDRVNIPAQSGGGATIDIGYGPVMGLPSPMKSRAGLLRPVREVAVGAVVTNGTFTAASADPPHGTYSPNSAPDGARDYSLLYETDLALT